jgi:hypothetical protein
VDGAAKFSIPMSSSDPRALLILLGSFIVAISNNTIMVVLFVQDQISSRGSILPVQVESGAKGVLAADWGEVPMSNGRCFAAVFSTSGDGVNFILGDFSFRGENTRLTFGGCTWQQQLPSRFF